MEKKNNIASVPYIVYETAMARNERTFKKMWGALILLILLLVGSNVGWLLYESQLETVEVYQEVEQEAEDKDSNQEESEEEFTDTEDLSDL